MFNALLNRNPNKTVAGVLSFFSKALADLKAVEQHHETEATKQAQNILEATAAHDASIGEAALARATAAKLEALVTVPVFATLNDLKEIQQ